MYKRQLSNSVGVIDSDYRGELTVGLVNHGDVPYTIQPGDRIAQLMVLPILRPTLTVVEELEDMGLAQVNIVLGNEGLAAAKYLQEKFGTPYVYAVPYGYNGTLSFLAQVGEAVGREPDSMVLLRLQTKEKSLSRLSLFTMMGNNKPKKAVVKGDYDLVQGVSAFLEQGGITVLHKMCAHSLKAIAEPAADVEAYAEESDWLQVIRGLQDTLILADDVALLQADADNTKVLISAPFINSAVATHMPFMGEKGADFLLEQMQAYCRR